MSTNLLLIWCSVCSWLSSLHCSRLFCFRLLSTNCTILDVLYLSNCAVPGVLYLSDCLVLDCLVPLSDTRCPASHRLYDTRCPVSLRLYSTRCPVSQRLYIPSVLCQWWYETRCPVSLRLYGTRCPVCEVVAGIPCCSTLYPFKQLGVFLLVGVSESWCVLQCRAYHSEVGGGPDHGGAVSEVTTRSCHRFTCHTEAGTISWSISWSTQLRYH